MSHYREFISSPKLQQLHTKQLPSLFYTKLHKVTLTERFIISLRTEFPHSKYLQHELEGLGRDKRGNLQLERERIAAEMRQFVHDFVKQEWDGIRYEIGERVYAVFENEWYVATVLDLQEEAALQGEQNHTDNANADMFSGKSEENGAESKPVSHANDVYHVRFVGYGNEAHLTKHFIKPYVDIPSEYLKAQTPVHAVFYEDQQLYEGVVDTFLADTNSVVVKFVGYGNKQDTELKDVRVLTNAAKVVWYKYEEYTLEKAQEEVYKDVLERHVLWEQTASQNLDPKDKEEILVALNKEAQGEAPVLNSSVASETTAAPQQPSQQTKPASITSQSIKSDKKRDGKRKRDEVEAEKVANQWNSWQKKVKKRRGDITEKAAKKTSKISEKLNQVQEVPAAQPRASLKGDSQDAVPTPQVLFPPYPPQMMMMPPYAHMMPPYGMPPPYAYMYGAPPPYPPQGAPMQGYAPRGRGGMHARGGRGGRPGRGGRGRQ